MNIAWTDIALEDLLAIQDYISHDSMRHAIDFGESLAKYPMALEGNPRLGRIVPEFKDENIRELILGNYRIIYRIKTDLIQIAAIVNSKQMLFSDKLGS